MKLHDCPRDCFVRILKPEEPPPGMVGFTAGEIIWFGQIDGMYSYCKDSENNVVHLKAWTEVEILDVADIPDWGHSLWSQQYN